MDQQGVAGNLEGGKMSEDRLEQIRQAYPVPCGFPTIDWLISEVDRLREHLAQEVRVFDIRIDERNTTIATYRDLLEKCKILVGYAPNGTLWRENIDKALEQSTQD